MSIPLRLVPRAALSDAAHHVNEDAFGFEGNALWVLDGATGVSDVRVTPGPTDAAWLAHRVSGWLQQQTRAALPIGDRMAALQAALTQDFDLVCTAAHAGDAELPCACAAVAELDPDRAEIELNLIGDVTVLVAVPGAGVQCFSDQRAQRFGDETLQAWRRARAESDDPEGWWASSRRAILDNRQWVNRAGGYWVIHPRRPWAGEVRRHRVAAPAGSRVVALSDGLYRLVELFGRFDHAALVARAFDAGGPAALLGELRALERADPSCHRHARVKSSDDATLVAAEVIAVSPT